MSSALLVQVVVSVSVILATAWATTRLMAGRSAAARHLVWAVALVLGIALPIVTLGGPTWSLPILNAEQARAALSQPEATPASRIESVIALDLGSSPRALAPALSVESPAAFQRLQPRVSVIPTIDPLPVLLAIWAVGALLGLVRLATGLARVAWISRHATLVRDLSWRVALAESSRALSIRPNVALRTTDETDVPVTCGVWAPAILLPVGAGEWSEDRRRVVLLHELAHVKRGDCLIQVAAQIALVIHWFNPLAHVAARRLRLEQEHACDDLVLLSGTEPPTYADHLVELARAVRTRGLPAWATLAMAQPSQLEGRLRAILDHQQARRSSSPRVRVLASSLVLLAVLPLGALRLTAADQTPPAPAPAATMPMAVVQVPQPAPSPAPEALAPAPQPAPRVAVPAPESRAASVDLVRPVPAPHFGFDHLLTPTVDWFDHVDAHGTPFVAQTAQAPATPAEEEARRRAAEALGTALNDENERVRHAAVQALASMRDPRAIPGLVRALQSSDVSVRQMAVNSLRRFDTDESMAGLVSAMKDSSPEVRMQAAAALAGSTNTRAIDALTAALKDSDPRVRERAASSLGSIASGRRGRVVADLYIDQLKLQETVALSVQNAEERARVTEELATLQSQFALMRQQLTNAQQQTDAVNAKLLQEKMEEVRKQIDTLQQKLGELRTKHEVFVPVPIPPAPPPAPTRAVPPAPPAPPAPR